MWAEGPEVCCGCSEGKPVQSVVGWHLLSLGKGQYDLGGLQRLVVYVLNGGGVELGSGQPQI